MGDALLALLDNATSAATLADYKQLTEQLQKRFAPSTGIDELRFSLGNRDKAPLIPRSHYTIEPNRAMLGTDKFGSIV